MADLMMVNGKMSCRALATLNIAIRNTDILEKMLKTNPDSMQRTLFFSNMADFMLSMDTAVGKQEPRMRISVTEMRR